MSANVETMASDQGREWHGKANHVADTLTAAEFIAASGLNWSVELQQLALPDGRLVNRWAVIRTSDQAIVGDGVGSIWRPLQNVDAFAWFDPFVLAGTARYTTAGSLCHGRRIFVSAELNKAPSEITPGDEVKKFLLLSNSHDGSLAVRVGFTPVRVVCSNTLAMAHGSDASKLIRIRHCKGTAKALEDVQQIVNAADAEFEATAEQYRGLARREINQTELRQYVKTVFQMEADDAMSTRSKNILSEILSGHSERNGIVAELLAGEEVHHEAAKAGDAAILDSVLNGFECGRGVADVKPDHRHNYWTAYNAVTEHLTHHRGHNADARLNSLYYGDSAQINARALSTALAMSS